MDIILSSKRTKRIVCNFNITVTKYESKVTTLLLALHLYKQTDLCITPHTRLLLFNFKDGDFNFEFAQFDQIEFNEETINNQLTALFAYYAYLIIGIDLDSFHTVCHFV